MHLPVSASPVAHAVGLVLNLAYSLAVFYILSSDAVSHPESAPGTDWAHPRHIS
jgi:hypothetical protein